MTDCIPLYEVSQYPHEREYLVPPFSRWAVDGVRREEGIVCVTLRWKGCATSNELQFVMRQRIQADNTFLSKDGGTSPTISPRTSMAASRSSRMPRLPTTASLVVDELECSMGASPSVAFPREFASMTVSFGPGLRSEEESPKAATAEPKPSEPLGGPLLNMWSTDEEMSS
eukprot:Hpha_TRINITY_DN14977_c5_g2::TRINITY_DN14977_c5_g2_i2::g.144531::m.144531